MNYVGIDPSLISTAICVNGKLINYCRESDANGKTGMKKWFKMCEHLVQYKYITYNQFSNYSEGELVKLNDYDIITDMIVEDIKTNINPDYPTKVGIEGYSFSSEAGDLIDLVTFSTLLRKKIYDRISKDLTVMSPSSLKMETCRFSYEPVDIGKKKPKLEWRNNQGISGGKFKKPEMFLAIIENQKLTDEWAKYMRQISDEILGNKNIMKPLEDVNDAYLLHQILLNTWL
jgi:hypothetical protein